VEGVSYLHLYDRALLMGVITLVGRCSLTPVQSRVESAWFQLLKLRV
jgi:hypothetical protein